MMDRMYRFGKGHSPGVGLIRRRLDVSEISDFASNLCFNDVFSVGRSLASPGILLLQRLNKSYFVECLDLVSVKVIQSLIVYESES